MIIVGSFHKLPIIGLHPFTIFFKPFYFSLKNNCLHLYCLKIPTRLILVLLPSTKTKVGGPISVSVPIAVKSTLPRFHGANVAPKHMPYFFSSEKIRHVP